MSGTESPVVPSPPRPHPHLTATRLPPLPPRALLGQELCSRPLGAHHPEGVSLRPQLTAEARGRGPLLSPRGSLGTGKAVGVFFRAGCSGLAPSGSGGWCRENWPSGALTSPWSCLLSLLPPRARCSFGQALAHRPAFPRPTDRPTGVGPPGDQAETAWPGPAVHARDLRPRCTERPALSMSSFSLVPTTGSN